MKGLEKMINATLTLPSTPQAVAMISPQYLSLHQEIAHPPSAYVSDVLNSEINEISSRKVTYFSITRTWSPWYYILLLL